MVKNEIQEKDEAVLKHLKKIIYEEKDDLSFKLGFKFENNDFFLDTILEKRFTLKDIDQPIKAEGTHIEWKEGKNKTK